MQGPTMVGTGKPSALKIVLYALAAIVALAGVAALVSILAYAANLESTLFLLNATMGPLANLLVSGLQAVLQSAGGFVFVVMAAIGLLLFVAGKLVARQDDMAARVTLLERSMASADATGLRSAGDGQAK